MFELKKTVRQMVISFCLTIIFLGGVWILGLTHYRIQNTIYASDYTLLEMHRVSENELEVLFDNDTFTVDLTPINGLWGDLSSMEIFIPASIRIVFNTLNLIVYELVEYISLLYKFNS